MGKQNHPNLLGTGHISLQKGNFKLTMDKSVYSCNNSIGEEGTMNEEVPQIYHGCK